MNGATITTHICNCPGNWEHWKTLVKQVVKAPLSLNQSTRSEPKAAWAAHWNAACWGESDVHRSRTRAASLGSHTPPEESGWPPSAPTCTFMLLLNTPLCHVSKVAGDVCGKESPIAWIYCTLDAICSRGSQGRYRTLCGLRANGMISSFFTARNYQMDLFRRLRTAQGLIRYSFDN